MAKSKGIPGTITDPKKALAYMLQANTNIITFQSAKTGERRTFRVKPMDKAAVAEKGIQDQRFFVSFLSGPENTRDYTYLGQILNGKFTLTQKSRATGINDQTPSFIIFKAAFETLMTATVMPKMLQVTHSGRCGKCHKALTVPQSVNDGFGPECVTTVGALAPCPVPDVKPISVGGTAAPQPNKFRYVPRGGESLRTARTRLGVSGRAVAAALYGRPATTADGGSFLDDKVLIVAGCEVSNQQDAEIRAKIEEYKANGPENYWQDGEVEEPEAFECAYRKFYRQLEAR